MIDTALKNIRRSPYQAFAAIAMTGLTVFIVGIFVLVSLGSHAILRNFETKPQLIAYLKDDYKQPDVDILVNTLKATGLTKEINFVNKQQAFDLYKKSIGNDPLLLGSVTDLGLITADVLPASVEITAKTPDNFPSLVEVLKKSDVVSTTADGQKEIDFPQDVVSELTAWTKGVRTLGLVLISMLSLNSVITIMIIVSMKISSRRTEIGTMKLLGAGGWFIIKPYLVESSLYGTAGAIIGWLATFITLLYSTPFLASRLTGIISLPVSWEVHLMLFGGLLLTFTFLGLFSGLLASLRFLKR